MLLSGYYLLCGKETFKYQKEPFVENYIIETFNEPVGCGYFEFDSNRIEEFKNFLPKTNYIMNKKNIYEYKNGQFKFITKCSRTAKQIYLYYKKAYSQIDKNNKKYAYLSNSSFKISKIRFKGFDRYRFCNKLDYTLPYALHVPKKKSENKKFPIYILLHGLFGGDEKAIAPIFHMKNIYKRLDMSNSIVLIPSLPKSVGFPTDLSGKVPFASKNSFDGILTSLLEQLLKKYPIDEKRIHIIGISNGAMGVYTQLYLHPHRYASAIALMGCMDLSNIDNELEFSTPIWMVHSADDKNVSIDIDAYGFSGSDVIFKKLGNQENRNLKYTRYETGGHNIANKFIKEKDWINWTLTNIRFDFSI